MFSSLSSRNADVPVSRIGVRTHRAGNRWRAGTVVRAGSRFYEILGWERRTEQYNLRRLWTRIIVNTLERTVFAEPGPAVDEEI